MTLRIDIEGVVITTVETDVMTGATIVAMTVVEEETVEMVVGETETAVIVVIAETVNGTLIAVTIDVEIDAMTDAMTDVMTDVMIDVMIDAMTDVIIDATIDVTIDVMIEARIGVKIDGQIDVITNAMTDVVIEEITETLMKTTTTRIVTTEEVVHVQDPALDLYPVKDLTPLLLEISPQRKIPAENLLVVKTVAKIATLTEMMVIGKNRLLTFIGLQTFS